MELGDIQQKEKKTNLLFLYLLFFSLPLLISIIFLIYIFILKYNINIYIPELINFNNNYVYIIKLSRYKYDKNIIIQYLKLYDFLIFLIIIFIFPYFFALTPILFGKTGKNIKSYMIIAHMKLFRLIFGILLFTFGMYFFGINFAFYFMDYEINMIRSGYLELLLFYRIMVFIFSLAFWFAGFVGIYKFILLKVRLNSKKSRIG